MNEWRKVEAGHCLWSNENLVIDDEKFNFSAKIGRFIGF